MLCSSSDLPPPGGPTSSSHTGSPSSRLAATVPSTARSGALSGRYSQRRNVATTSSSGVADSTAASSGSTGAASQECLRLLERGAHPPCRHEALLVVRFDQRFVQRIR